MPGHLNVRAGLFGAAVAAASLFTPAAWAEDKPSPREVEIVVKGGYQPNLVKVTQGERVRLKFVRREYAGCTKEVVFPTLGIKKTLPTDKPVLIDLPALEPGEVPFHCGMKMIKGTVQVEPVQ